MSSTLQDIAERSAQRNGHGPAPAEQLRAAIESGELHEIEVHWPDHQGHPRGKRMDARDFLARAAGQGFAFCDAALCWDVAGDVKDGLRLSSWDTGFPDLFAIPDLDSYRRLPWRERTGFVTSDVRDHHGELIRTAPRTVLRRVIERLSALGYEAEVGVEIEFHLLRSDGVPLSDGVQAYSLQKLAELDPTFGEVLAGLRDFVELEGGNTEYGPGQAEVNLRHARALAAADQAARFKYATRELARRAGALATFMAKPFGDQAGNSMHLHVSLWREGADGDPEPAFAPARGTAEHGATGTAAHGATENELHRRALGGVLAHLPGIVLYGAPTVNSYKRFEPLSFAPSTATWGADNRTVAIRSLVESPAATRIELRTGAADSQPHWSIAALLAAIVAGIEDGEDPGVRGEGNLYASGAPLPRTLSDGVAAARADQRIVEILGVDAVHDFTALADAEWATFVGAVTDWDRERYLRTI
jgi:glutamine synthetase